MTTLRNCVNASASCFDPSRPETIVHVYIYTQLSAVLCYSIYPGRISQGRKSISAREFLRLWSLLLSPAHCVSVCVYTSYNTSAASLVKRYYFFGRCKQPDTWESCLVFNDTHIQHCIVLCTGAFIRYIPLFRGTCRINVELGRQLRILIYIAEELITITGRSAELCELYKLVKSNCHHRPTPRWL